MKKILALLLLSAMGLHAQTTNAAPVPVSALTNAAPISAGDFFYLDQTTQTPKDRKVTAATVQAYMMSNALTGTSTLNGANVANGTIPAAALNFSLAAVATSGSYNDLSSKPTIPAAQVNSDWNAVSGVAQILNKPTTLSGYGITDPVALTSGSYANPAWITALAYSKLTGAPTIPTNNNQLTNGAGYITSSGTVTSITGTISNTQVSGLGTASTHAATDFDAAGAASTAQAASLQKSSNLSDLPNAATARTSLHLTDGTATVNVVNQGSSAKASIISMPIGTSAHIFLAGDSTTHGDGVTDPRQTYPGILASLGLGSNAEVINYGYSGYMTASVAGLYTSAQNVPTWTNGATAPVTQSVTGSSLIVSGDWVTILLGTNNYFGRWFNGTESTSSNIVTGLSTTTYYSDGVTSHTIQVGDTVTGTGITGTATITAVGSGQVTLNQTPTSNGVQLLKFTPGAASVTSMVTDISNFVATIKGTSGVKVAIYTIPPANNVTVSPSNNTGAQGDYQSVRLALNAGIRGLTFDGIGNDPDLLIDLAQDPAFATFNSALFSGDKLHENFAGNQQIALDVNVAILAQMSPVQFLNALGQESIPTSWLPTTVPNLTATNTFTVASQQFGSSGTGTGSTGTVTVYDKISLIGSAVGDISPSIDMTPALSASSTIRMRGGSGTSGTVTMTESAGSVFSIGIGLSGSTLSWPTAAFGNLGWSGNNINIGGGQAQMDCNDVNNIKLTLGATGTTTFTIRNHTATQKLQFGFGTSPTIIADLNSAQGEGDIETTQAVANTTASVSNTTSETTLVPATTGSMTIPANSLVAGAHYRLRARGVINNTGTPTLEIKAYLGSTAIADTTAITTVSVSGNNLWSFDDEFTCQSTGASGSVYAQGQFSYFSAATTSNVAQAGNSAATTIDTTASQLVSIKATWGTASASNSITCTNLTLERVY